MIKLILAFILISSAFLILLLLGDRQKISNELSAMINQKTSDLQDEYRMKADQRVLDRSIELSWIDKINLSVEKSNIPKNLPFFNGMTLILICFVVGVSTLWIVSSKMPVLGAVLVAAFAFYSPIILVDTWGIFVTLGLRKEYKTFLSNFQSQYRSVGDVFEAFRGMLPYLNDPLATYIEHACDEYEGKVGMDIVFERLKWKIGYDNFAQFLDLLLLVALEGGDVLLLIENKIDQETSLEKSRLQRISATTGYRIGTYAVIAVSILIKVNLYFTQPIYVEIMSNPFYGTVVYAFDSVVIFFSLRKSFKTQRGMI